MAERIQEILAREIQAAIVGENLRREQGLKDLAKRVSRADARGWFSQDASSLQAESISLELQVEW